LEGTTWEEYDGENAVFCLVFAAETVTAAPLGGGEKAGFTDAAYTYSGGTVAITVSVDKTWTGTVSGHTMTLTDDENATITLKQKVQTITVASAQVYEGSTENVAYTGDDVDVKIGDLELGTVTGGPFTTFTLPTTPADIADALAGATPIDWTDVGTLSPANATAYVVWIELFDDAGKIGQIVPAKYTDADSYSIVQYLYAENDFTVTGTGVTITAKYGWNQVCVTQNGATQTITTVTALPEDAKWLLECNRSGVTEMQVYQANGIGNYTFSDTVTVKIGGLEAGTVTAAGILSFMLPVPVPSDNLVEWATMEGQLKTAAGWTNASIVQTGAKAQLWENLELYDENELLGTISLGKTVSDTVRNVYFMYFDREFDIDGSGGTNTNNGTFHSSRGWNIFHPYLGGRAMSAFLDDALNNIGDDVKWVFTAVD
jgi:hypothetical protein